MFIFFVFILLFFSLYITKKYISNYLYSDKTIIIGNFVINDKNNELEEIIASWLKSSYQNDLISYFLPKNSEEVLILCSYYKTNKIKETKIIAVPKKTLILFINKQNNLKLFIKETPKRNIFLSCKIKKVTFDIILKLPYLNDKPEIIEVIENSKKLESIFF